MPSAFDSPKQAAAFALLLLFLLAAPWLADKTFLPGRAQTYSSQSIPYEKYPWIQKYMLEDTNAIDIAIMGSSRIGYAIDTGYVQRRLEERLGRKAVVRTFVWFNAGFDIFYFFTKDILAHRQVKTLVLCDELWQPKPSPINKWATDWFRFSDGGRDLSGLPFADQSLYYFAAVIGMPRNLLELTRDNLPEDTNGTRVLLSSWADTYPEMTLGCINGLISLDPTFDKNAHVGFDTFFTNTNFTRYFPPTGLTPDALCVYTPAAATNFVFSSRPLPASQLYFARQFGRLATSHGCKLVLLHLPLYIEKSSPAIPESRNWPDLLQTDVCMMGIPPARFFAGLSEKKVGWLFVDPWHLNANGQRYFTPLITPALLKFYEVHFPD